MNKQIYNTHNRDDQPFIHDGNHASDGSEPALASWRDGPTKRAILQFVEQVTDRNSPTYVAPAKRIAAFDNDGTLWCEKPSYTQELFIIQHFRHCVEADPQLREVQPYKAFWENDRAYFKNLTIQELGVIIIQAVSSSLQADYEAEIHDFFVHNQHPTYHRPFTETAYVPMLELVCYLQDNAFQVYIVTGGDTDFVRSVSEIMYGIPRSHVIGTSVEIKLDVRDGQPILARQNKIIEPFNEGTGKAINMHLHIGQRPILSVGNSDGDIDMLHFTTHPDHPTLPLLIQHDDDEREFAYDTGAKKAQEMARERGWHIISMKKDFQRVFAFED
ncbi:HAD family hydrolase [Dictyobacter arantiisoli]|uniref:Acid phosphatase n=1 Tax=Dictyobacter arantiisoli TaxID=2014874 RepID=A0A5A5T6B6_9CHLR|nr:HAD family hydrolase [Dictyobacter arantiisoli]GCF06908.1 acid phosphatase [Dictyobacter arantiisoli]